MTPGNPQKSGKRIHRSSVVGAGNSNLTPSPLRPRGIARLLPNRVIIITIAPDNAPPLGCKCPRRDNVAPEKTHVCGSLVLGAPLLAFPHDRRWGGRPDPDLFVWRVWRGRPPKSPPKHSHVCPAALPVQVSEARQATFMGGPPISHEAGSVLHFLVMCDIGGA